jgi:monoterpene epsilon-lactone hydrolase
MSQEQRAALDTLLRHAPLDLGGEVHEQRATFVEMMGGIPVPDDVTATSGKLGGVPVVDIELPNSDPARIICYLHGGAYAIGSADLSVGLASDLARRSATPEQTLTENQKPAVRA